MGNDMTPDDEDVSRQVRDFGTRHRAPDSLRAGLRAHLALSEALRTPAAASTTTPPPPPRPAWGQRLRGWVMDWHQGMAGLALGALLMTVVPALVTQLGLEQPDAAELVASHVRALQTGPLTQVVSSDQHTVKPWFQGRLDYSPPVLDLVNDGFPLLGGRIERLHGNTVATLAYARRRHVIDLYVWPGSARAVQMNATHRGYHVLHWSDADMQYWAVSDLDPRELAQFMQLWRDRTLQPLP